MIIYRFPYSQIACQHYCFSPTNHPHNQWPTLFLVERLECLTGRVIHASSCGPLDLLSNSLYVYTYIFAYSDRVQCNRHNIIEDCIEGAKNSSLTQCSEMRLCAQSYRTTSKCSPHTNTCGTRVRTLFDVFSW